MFRTVRLSTIRSLFTVDSAIVYVIQVCRKLSSRSICSCSKAVYNPVWHIQLLSLQWINSWWWTDELSETCGVLWQNKFVKLVHLVGFITKKFVTMHGHTNVKLCFIVDTFCSTMSSILFILFLQYQLFHYPHCFCIVSNKHLCHHIMSYASEIRTPSAHSQDMKLPGAIIITFIFPCQADELLESTTASTPVLAN